MPEPLSIHTRRVERLERELQRERWLTALAVVVFLSFLGTLLACPALAIWSSVRGWNAGAACVALGVTGGPLTLISGAVGTAWIFYRVDEGTADELEKARDEYDRELQQVVRNA